jgi:hypothetical protein
MAADKDTRTWDIGDEHQDKDLYARYHKDVYMPSWVVAGAKAFLPDRGTDLLLSRHYLRVQDERHLPPLLYMPMKYDIVDVTTVREVWAIFRVLIRAPFNKVVDIGIVLEGDHEVVTAFFLNPSDDHATLDTSVYEHDTHDLCEEREGALEEE